MFVFVSGISQAHEPVDGECAVRTQTEDVEDENRRNVLCESGSFVEVF